MTGTDRALETIRGFMDDASGDLVRAFGNSRLVGLPQGVQTGGSTMSPTADAPGVPV